MSRIASSGTVRQRDPRVHDKGHLARVRKLPCLPCLIRRGATVTPSEACHVKVGYPEAGWRAFGHSERAHDQHCLPMCGACHRTGPMAQHGNHGGDERYFWDELRVHPPTVCAALVEAFGKGLSGWSVINRFADLARRNLSA